MSDYKDKVKEIKDRFAPNIKKLEEEIDILHSESSKKIKDKELLRKKRKGELRDLTESVYLSDIYPDIRYNHKYKLDGKNKYHYKLGEELFGNYSIEVVGDVKDKYHIVVRDDEDDDFYLKVRKGKLVKFLCKHYRPFKRELQLNFLNHAG